MTPAQAQRLLTQSARSFQSLPFAGQGEVGAMGPSFTIHPERWIFAELTEQPARSEDPEDDWPGYSWEQRIPQPDGEWGTPDEDNNEFGLTGDNGSTSGISVSPAYAPDGDEEITVGTIVVLVRGYQHDGGEADDSRGQEWIIIAVVGVHGGFKRIRVTGAGVVVDDYTVYPGVQDLYDDPTAAFEDGSEVWLRSRQGATLSTDGTGIYHSILEDSSFEAEEDDTRPLWVTRDRPYVTNVECIAGNIVVTTDGPVTTSTATPTTLRLLNLVPDDTDSGVASSNSDVLEAALADYANPASIYFGTDIALPAGTDIWLGSTINLSSQHSGLKIIGPHGGGGSVGLKLLASISSLQMGIAIGNSLATETDPIGYVGNWDNGTGTTIRVNQPEAFEDAEDDYINLFNFQNTQDRDPDQEMHKITVVGAIVAGLRTLTITPAYDTGYFPTDEGNHKFLKGSRLIDTIATDGKSIVMDDPDDALGRTVDDWVFVSDGTGISDGYGEFVQITAKWRGDWDSGTTYNVARELVRHGGVLYMVLQTTTNNEPPNATYWVVVPGDVTGRLYVEPPLELLYVTGRTVLVPGPWAEDIHFENINFGYFAGRNAIGVKFVNCTSEIGFNFGSSRNLEYVNCRGAWEGNSCSHVRWNGSIIEGMSITEWSRHWVLTDCVLRNYWFTQVGAEHLTIDSCAIEWTNYPYNTFNFGGFYQLFGTNGGIETLTNHTVFTNNRVHSNAFQINFDGNDNIIKDNYLSPGMLLWVYGLDNNVEGNHGDDTTGVVLKDGSSGQFGATQCPMQSLSVGWSFIVETIEEGVTLYSGYDTGASLGTNSALHLPVKSELGVSVGTIPIYDSPPLYEMDEASGDAIDSGGNGFDLTENGTVGAAAGPTGDPGARTGFSASNFFSADNAPFIIPRAGILTVICIFKLSDNTGLHRLMGIGTNPTADQWFIYHFAALGGMGAGIQDYLTAGANYYATTYGVIPVDTWVVLFVEFNGSARTTKLWVNDQVTADSGSLGLNYIIDASVDFTMGDGASGQEGDVFTVARTFFLNRELSSAERAAIYNGGNFNTWPIPLEIDANSITSGTLPVARGGTGHTTLSAAASDGATITFDLDDGLTQTVTLGGNRTLVVSNDANGQTFTIVLKQDATPPRTVTWWSGINWAAGVTPTLTAVANKRDVFTFLRIGSGDYLGFVAGQNYS